MQVGFMSREFLVISALDGWYWEVAVAHSAIWAALTFITWEVWQFSKVRDARPDSVDQVLDMLLLPVNYGFFCGLCVRILKLQPEGTNSTMVSVVIESADIWEAWALWSVLALFVRVVDTASSRDPRREQDPEYREAIRGFKNLSLQGVKTWVFILSFIITFNVVLKGVLAVRAPTVCYWAYQQCMSCDEWYQANIHFAAQSIIFILCSFALVFVFTFERVFEEYLSIIQPFWKFWGVKGVVSVTYFQWLIINYCFGLRERDIYLVHCLLCSVEMPALAMLHATCAYPFGKPWMEALLDSGHKAKLPAQENAVEMQALPAPACREQEDPDQDPPADESPLASRGSDEPDDEPDLAEKPGPLELLDLDEASDVSCAGCCFAAALWAGCCYGSYSLVIHLVPVEEAQEVPVALYNFTCTKQGDVAHFLEEQSDLHWELPEGAGDSLRIPGTAGIWLPFCGSVPVQCQAGYYGGPSIRCTSNGTYVLAGRCRAKTCGEPLKLPHAQAKWKDVARQDFTTGATVSYDCDPGYRGSPMAICGRDQVGKYTVEGSCTEVVCGAPPTVPHASPLGEHGTGAQGDEPVRMGAQVPYQCAEGFRGQPIAYCGHDGYYTLRGRCAVDCGPPPGLQNAVPNGDHTLGPWTEGTQVPYECTSGFGGRIVAVCGAGGNYSVSGGCQRVCGLPTQLENARPLVDGKGDKWPVGTRVAYQCDPGYEGTPLAECGEDGRWELHHGTAGCIYRGCGSLGSHLVDELGSNWSSIMRVSQSFTLTPGSLGNVRVFECLPGRVGLPLATCSSGRWSLTGHCEPVLTSSGCRCRTQWSRCEGWIGRKCQAWHGCALHASESYAWCEVERRSCPSTAKGTLGAPSWDYCSAGPLNATASWRPTEIDEGPGQEASAKVTLGAISLVGVALLCIRRCLRPGRLTARTVQAPRNAVPPPESVPSLELAPAEPGL